MMNGTQQIVGGLLAFRFTLLHLTPSNPGKLSSSLTVELQFSGVFVGWWMPGSLMRAKCFTEEDKYLMVERARVNQTGLQNKQFKRLQMIELFKDPKNWWYCGIAVFTTLPTSGLGAFANIIITGLHFSVLQVQLLAMVLCFYIIMVLLSSAWLVKKTSQNLLVMLAFVIP